MSAGEGLHMPLDRDTLLRGVRKLPSLPAVVIELLQSMDREDTDTRRLAAKLAQDQALAARVLRVANSSFYGLQGKVETISDAVAVLGLNGLRTLATAAAVTGAFAGGKHGEGGYDLASFWRHSVAVALCAREIARRRHMNEGNAFAAGLLHDIGRLALASSFPEHLAAVAQARAASGDCWLFAERHVLGTDHAEIGRQLTEHWCFPATLSGAIGAHHAPGKDATAGNTLAAVVHLADALAHLLPVANPAPVPLPPVETAAWETVGLDEATAQDVLAVVEMEFDAASDAVTS